MIRAATLLAMLASPAFAQDADPLGQLVEGYSGCLIGAGDVEATQTALATQGWTQSEDGEDGLVYFYPGVGNDSFIFMANDGSFCHVESLKVDGISAAEALAAVLEANGIKSTPSKDDMGCTLLTLDTGAVAALTSGGQDPVCGSDTDSAVQFTFE